MTIGEYIKQTDRDTYNRLKLLCKEDVIEVVAKAFKVPSSVLKEIELGDSIENLMRADSYSRSKGKIVQRRWG